MNNSTSSTDCKDVRDLRIPYLEDMLTDNEKSAFEQHLRICPDCAKDFEEISHWTTIVGNIKEQSCPEPWELFDLVRADELSPELVAHLDECHSCREYEEAFRAGTSIKAMPAELRAKMVSTSDKPVEAPIWDLFDHWISPLAETIRNFFRVPVFAMGTAAAVVLLIVLLYPTGGRQPMVGLSSVQWESVMLKRQLMSGDTAKRARLATVLLFENFDQSPAQTSLDSLYEQLEPISEIAARVDWVTPAEIKDAVAKKKLGFTDRSKILKGLREELGAAQAVLITVSARNGDSDITAERVDTRSLEIIGKRKAKGVTVTEIAPNVKSTVQSVLGTAVSR